MINKQNKNHHRYLHKRIPDIIIDPKTKHKNKKNIDPHYNTMIKENPIYNLHTKKQYI